MSVEPTLMRLLLVMVAERLAVGAWDLMNLGPSVARVPNDDPRLRAIAEHVPDEVTWKKIEPEILSPDLSVSADGDSGRFLQEVLQVVKRALGTNPRAR